MCKDKWGLARSTSSGKTISEIDGVRFLAITLVLLHHNHFILSDSMPDIDEQPLIWRIYRALAEAGSLGVPLFFVVSGFILALPFAKQRLSNGNEVNLTEYFKRRIKRLQPPYIINLSILFTLIAFSNPVEHLAEKMPKYIASLFYLHNTVFNEWSSINFVAWSLEVEVQFYILAPLFGLIFLIYKPINRITLISVFLIIGSISNFYYSDANFRITNSLLVYSQYFFCGYLLTELFLTKKLYAKEPSYFFDVLALIFFVIAVCFETGYPLKGLRSFGVFPVLGFFLSVFKSRLALAFLRLPAIYLVGGMCYTIYLYHFWIIQLPVRAFDLDSHNFSMMQVLVFDIIMFSFVIAVSTILFKFFEKPFMSKK